MILIFQVLDNTLSTKISFLEDFIDCLKIVSLKSLLEEIISIIDLTSSHLSLSGEIINCISQEESDINWLFKGSEHA